MKTSLISIIIIVLFIIAALIGVITIVLYRKRANSVLQGTFSDNTDVIFISGDGTETEMKKIGEGRYEAEFKTDLFKENYSEPGIIIKENGTSVFEEIKDESFYGIDTEYWQVFIPSLVGEFGIDNEYYAGGIKVMNIHMFSNYKSKYNIASAKVIIEKNGTEIDSIDAIKSFEEAVGEIIIPVDKEYTFNDTDSIDGKLILTTEEGYKLEQVLFDRNDGRFINYGTRFKISDKNGKVVLSR